MQVTNLFEGQAISGIDVLLQVRHLDAVAVVDVAAQVGDDAASAAVARVLHAHVGILEFRAHNQNPELRVMTLVRAQHGVCGRDWQVQQLVD